MIRIVARSFALLLALAAACGGSDSSKGSGSTGNGPDAGVSGIVALSLSQTDVHIPKNTTTAFAVTATRADGSRIDVTGLADAQSSNTKIATVERGPGAQIQIHSQNEEGTATITVTVGNLLSTCAVTVFPN